LILLVTGGRDFRSKQFVFDVLSLVVAYRDITMIRHGACPTGVDAHVAAWCRSTHFPVDAMPADWETYGDRAGPIRNRQMAEKLPRPAALLAFPGGPGTKSMRRIAAMKKFNIPILDALEVGGERNVVNL
jgi:hypothetical protein